MAQFSASEIKTEPARPRVFSAGDIAQVRTDEPSPLAKLGSAFWEGIGGKAVVDMMGGASRNDPARQQKALDTAKASSPGWRMSRVGEATKHLLSIIRKLTKPERTLKLEQIDRNHEAWCLTESWTKDGGEYSKGLNNWLAPTMGRYGLQPPARASPAPKKGFAADVERVIGERLARGEKPW
jgi:hypothetical protein